MIKQRSASAHHRPTSFIPVFYSRVGLKWNGLRVDVITELIIWGHSWRHGWMDTQPILLFIITFRVVRRLISFLDMGCLIARYLSMLIAVIVKTLALTATPVWRNRKKNFYWKCNFNIPIIQIVCILNSEGEQTRSFGTASVRGWVILIRTHRLHWKS